MNKPVSSIDTSQHARVELGDLTTLVESIKQDGLRCPIVLVGDTLLFGARRLAAYKELGSTEIPATVIVGGPEALEEYRKECSDTTGRKEMTLYEKVLLVRRIVALDDHERDVARRANMVRNSASMTDAARALLAEADNLRAYITPASSIVPKAIGVGQATVQRVGRLQRVFANENYTTEIRDLAREELEAFKNSGSSLQGGIARVERAIKGEPEPTEHANWNKTTLTYAKRVNAVIERIWSSLTQAELAGLSLQETDIELLMDSNLSNEERQQMKRMARRGARGLLNFSESLDERTEGVEDENAT